MRFLNYCHYSGMGVSFKVSLLLPFFWRGVSFKFFLRNFSRLFLGMVFIIRKNGDGSMFSSWHPQDAENKKEIKDRKTGRK